MNAEKYERTGSHVAGKDVLCALRDLGSCDCCGGSQDCSVC